MAGVHYMLAPRDSVSFIPEFPLFSVGDRLSKCSQKLFVYIFGFSWLPEVPEIVRYMFYQFLLVLDVSEPKLY